MSIIKSITDKGVILDLDETCLHTFKNISLLHDLKILTDPQYIKLRKRIYILNLNDLTVKGDGRIVQVWGVMRPGLRKFLKFCFIYFKVVTVWSAGLPSYVHGAVEKIFRGLPTPIIVFSRTDCLNEGNKYNMILSKPIEKMINYNDNIKNIMSIEKTFIIDDRIDYVKYNFNNGIIIPPYNPSPNIGSMLLKDYALIKIIMWLLQPDVSFTMDIRLIKKDNIFTIHMNDVEKYINNFNSELYFNDYNILINSLNSINLKYELNNNIMKSNVVIVP